MLLVFVQFVCLIQMNFVVNYLFIHFDVGFHFFPFFSLFFFFFSFPNGVSLIGSFIKHHWFNLSKPSQPTKWLQQLRIKESFQIPRSYPAEALSPYNAPSRPLTCVEWVTYICFILVYNTYNYTNCVPLWQQIAKEAFEIFKCFDKWFVSTVVMK